MRLIRIGQETQAGSETEAEWIDIDVDEPGAEKWFNEQSDICESTREILRFGSSAML